MKKRVNKAKEQIQRDMAMEEKRKAKLARDKFIASTIFPFVENLPTAYDAQTAFNAVAGYIDDAVGKQVSKILVKDLQIAVAKGGKADKELYEAVMNILNSMADIPADSVSELTQKMGQKLAEFVANKGLAEKMTIKTSDFVAK